MVIPRFGYKKDDGGDWATMHEELEGMESPGSYVDELVSRDHFCLALAVFFLTALSRSGGLSIGEWLDAVT